LLNLLLYGFACYLKASRNNILFSVGISRLEVPVAHSSGAVQTLNALYVPKGLKRKEERLKFKRCIRWILPLLVLVLIATYFVLSPVLASHAAGPGSSPIHIIAPHYLTPNYFWYP